MRFEIVITDRPFLQNGQEFRWGDFSSFGAAVRTLCIRGWKQAAGNMWYLPEGAAKTASIKIIGANNKTNKIPSFC